MDSQLALAAFQLDRALAANRAEIDRILAAWGVPRVADPDPAKHEAMR